MSILYGCAEPHYGAIQDGLYLVCAQLGQLQEKSDEPQKTSIDAEDTDRQMRGANQQRTLASRKPKLENGKDFQRPDAVLLE